MPILDPNLQFYLIEETLKSKDTKNYKGFFLRYLRVASRNINKNFLTLKASNMFKDDLKNSINIINYIFHCKLNRKQIENPMILDFYGFLYDQITSASSFNAKDCKRVRGRYFKQKTDPTKIFFQPQLFSKNHSWYFSDSPIAILSINLDHTIFNNKNEFDFFQLIYLEIDLLQAAGLALILCFKYSIDNDLKDHSNYINELIRLIGRDQFIEIHCNFKKTKDTEHFYENYFHREMHKINKFKGFMYIYSPYAIKTIHHFKKLQKQRRFYIFYFSSDFKKVLEPTIFENIEEFNYYKTGFKKDSPKELKVRLSNVPLYSKKENDQSFIPSKITFCYVSLEDFQNWTDERIEIVLLNEKDGNYTKYVNFNDLHSIKRDLYAKDTLLLTDINESTLEKIDELESEIKKIKNRRNRRNSIQIKGRKGKIKLAAYYYAHINSSKKTFSLHRPQIYTILDAENILLGKKRNNNSLSLNQLKKRKKKLENKLIMKANKNPKDFMHPDLQNILTNKSLRDEFNQVLKNQTSSPTHYIDNFITKFNKEDDIKNEIERIDDQLKNNDQISLSRGVIYQVETGEGKTCIISVLAAVLALEGKKVHIASSNIKLSNRDYMKSFDYFNLLKIKSAVFLHQNELPNFKTANKEEYDKLDKCYNITNDKKRFNYYNEAEFNNSSKMNFTVCGLDCDNKIPPDSPNVIFSTIVNFECFYLKMLELCPGYVDDYFENCVLLIDEADSVLIDEIANGTIVSKSMKTNMKDVLLYVYDNKKNGVPVKETYREVKRKWPKIEDLTSKDIERMYHEIDLVNQPDFKNGKRYYIDSCTVKNEKKKSKLAKNALNFVRSAAQYVGKISGKFGKAIIKEISNNDEEEDNNENEEEEIEIDDSGDDDDEKKEDEDYEPETTFHYIVPFDYDHKGILEPNKEFSGFIQQFIAIKESIENNVENMIIKDVSMSYLYVSHPVFVKLYSKVCGFTGTIGKKDEKRIFKEEYNLATKKVPRNRPNKRVELPMILCSTIIERNKKIVSEILEFHSRGNPVLVIFEDLNEIARVKRLLELKNVRGIYTFDGKNRDISAEKIAGKKSAISLGTNFCGRGTNIVLEDKKKPLHVIISYYTSNTRVLKQAHGRTARQGQKGTSRIICLKKQYLSPKMFSDNGVDEAVEEFRIKNQLQSEYIELFQMTRPWIFLHDFKKLSFNDEQIKTMRDIRINVNRIVAYNYEFPLQMSITTFLKIQAQKIVSLINCPNTKYTWRLFQQYIREMILESWSLMINEADRRFFDKKENAEYMKDFDELKNISISLNKTINKRKVEKYNKKFKDVFKKYEDHLKRNVDTLLTSLLDYLPLVGKIKNTNPRHIDETFMHIINKVVKENQNKILSLYKNSNKYVKLGNNTFVGCQFGFRPFALLSESGARIVQRNYRQLNYIKDPELMYLQRLPENHKLCLLSITQKIDDLFNEICKKINDFIGKNTLLRFFLRRTLCGCEFGICFNFESEIKEFDEKNCLFDKEPLLLFTINVRSLVPILAGILIIALVYLAYLTKEIVECIAALPEKCTKDLVIKGLIICCEFVGKDVADKIFGKVCEVLNRKLDIQIKKIGMHNEEYADIISKIKNCFTSRIGKKMNNELSSFLSDKIKVKIGWLNKIKRLIDPEKIMKISLYLLLCLATFIITFNQRKDALQNAKDDSKEYNKHLDENDMKDAIHDLEKKNESCYLREKIEINDIRKRTIDFDRFEKNIFSKYLYRFLQMDLSTKIIKLSDMEEMNDRINMKLIKTLDIIAHDVRAFKNKENNRIKCLRFEYHEMKENFYKQVRILAMNELPSILNLVGYSVQNQKMYLFVENKGDCTLESLMKRVANNEIKLSETRKLIIAYGLAKALEILHSHNVVVRNLNPSNIVLQSIYYRPYIADFGLSIQTDLKPSYLICRQTLKTMNMKFVAPELKTNDFIVPIKIDPNEMDENLIRKYIENQSSKKLDVYSYGAILHLLFTGETIPDDDYEFLGDLDTNWNQLISDCLNDDYDSRPDFETITDIILKISRNKAIDKKLFNDYKRLFNK